jgi:hypothetical protein
MKPSDHFKNIIQQHLEARAATDPLFAVTFAKEGKNIDDCCTYILNQVQKSGCNGFADDEIFSMAVHYYDEDQIEVGKPVNARVVVNHHIEKEKPAPVVAPIPQEKKPAKEVKKSEYVQPSLFD